MVIEGLPDLAIRSEKQRAVKTGTDDNFLLDSCFQGALIRTPANTRGRQNIDNVQRMQLSDNNRGTKQTHNLLVGSLVLSRSLVLAFTIFASFLYPFWILMFFCK